MTRPSSSQPSSRAAPMPGRGGAPVASVVAARLAICAQAIDDLLEGRAFDAPSFAQAFAGLIEWVRVAPTAAPTAAPDGASDGASDGDTDWRVRAFEAPDGASTLTAHGPTHTLTFGLDPQRRPCLGLWRRVDGATRAASCMFQLEAGADGLALSVDTGERRRAAALPASVPLAWGSLASYVESLPRASASSAARADLTSVTMPAPMPMTPPCASTPASTPADGTSVFCEQCGARLGANARFCRACGTPVSTTSPR